MVMEENVASGQEFEISRFKVANQKSRSPPQRGLALRLA